MTNAPAYFSIKTGQATKVSAREGVISYRILTDADRATVFIKLDANESAGYHSLELVPFTTIKDALKSVKQNQPFPSKMMKSCFKSKSSNNSAFLCAVLRQENLLSAAIDSAHQSQLTGDWDVWQSSNLAMKGEPYELPVIESRHAKMVNISGADDGSAIGDDSKRKLNRKPDRKHHHPTTDEAGHVNTAQS